MAVERDDDELIAAVRQGDVASFEPLVRKYQPRVFATARRYARRESEVEDIVQEVFIKAYQRLGGYRGEAPFEHWLMRLAVRTCLDALRAERRRPELRWGDLSEDEAAWVQFMVAETADPAVLDSLAAREILEKLLGQLSPPDRLVITLLDLEQKSVREIAQVTGWSETLVKVRAFRARRKLRALAVQLKESERYE